MNPFRRLPALALALAFGCSHAPQAALARPSGSIWFDSFSVSATAIGDPSSGARDALAEGDFAGAKALLDEHLASSSIDPEARALRAIATLALAADEEVSTFLQNKIGATISVDEDGFRFRIPRPVAYDRNFPRFTVASGYFEYSPAINLYESDGAEPSISFENKGTELEFLTFTITRGADGPPDLETTFYLDGELLGYVNAFPPDFPLADFDSGSELSTSSFDGTVTVQLPPGAAFTISVFYSPGQLRFTPTSPLPATITVANGARTLITPARFKPGANLAQTVALAARLDSTALAPAIADLEVAAADTDFTLTLFPSETGHPQEILLARADFELLLAELKFFQAFRRLALPYDFSHPITHRLFSGDALEQLMKNRAFLTPRSGNFATDLASARALFTAAVDHYFAAGEAGLWTRPAPETGAYLFGVDTTDPELADQALALDTALTQFRDALHGPVPLTDLSDHLATDESLPDGASLNFSPLFGPRALPVRKLIPALAPESGLIIPGGSVSLLGSGLLPGVGTAWWENFLSERGLADDEVPALFAQPRIFSQPASLTVAEGTPATLRVSAESYPPPSYQWFRGVGAAATPLVGATGPAYTLPAADRDDADTYFVRVTNTLPGRRGPVLTTVPSKPARLTVTHPPEIISPPLELTRLAGRPARFSVVAEGSPAPSYQWFLDDAPLRNARKAAYSVVASPARAGAYKVTVANSRGELTTTPVRLTVHERPRFTRQPVTRTVPTNGFATFTVEVNGNPAPTLQWYQGTPKAAVPIEGATGPSHTATASGTYFARATNETVNAAGTGQQINVVNSRVVRLTFDPGITIGGVVIGGAAPGR